MIHDIPGDSLEKKPISVFLCFSYVVFFVFVLPETNFACHSTRDRMTPGQEPKKHIYVVIYVLRRYLIII